MMLEGEGDIRVDEASGTVDEDEKARGGSLGDKGRGQRVIRRQWRGVEVWVRREKKMKEHEEMSRSGLESK